MAFSRTFTTPRTTMPDRSSLIRLLQALDPTATLIAVAPPPERPSSYTIAKATAWLPAHITAAQNVLDTAPAWSPQLEAQAYVDAMPIPEKAWKMLEVEEFNRHRAALRTLGIQNLPDLLYPDIIEAWRVKAGEIS